MVIHRLRGFRSEIGLRRRPLENRSDITMSLVLGRINLRTSGLICGWIYFFVFASIRVHSWFIVWYLVVVLPRCVICGS
jgi:hypothetical protein